MSSSTILYYSNYCEHSKKLIQYLAKMNFKGLNYIRVDKDTIQKKQNQMFIILGNGRQIPFPKEIRMTPTLLIIQSNGQPAILSQIEQIYQYFQPRQEQQVKEATKNNMEPEAFSFLGGNIVSDKYGLLGEGDSYATFMADPEQNAHGGMSQMHNYMDLNKANQTLEPIQQPPQQQYQQNLPFAQPQQSKSRMGEGITVENLQKQRDQDLQKITGQHQQPRY